MASPVGVETGQSTVDPFELELQGCLRSLAERISVPDRPFAGRPPARMRMNWPWPRQRTWLGSSAMRVLVVEDDAPTRHVVTEALGDDGFDVVSAEDGARALTVAAATHPDLIVLDLGLPVLDGPSFAARWRQQPDGANVPIVVMSGRPDGKQTAAAMGADAFYRKPLDLAVLSAAIRSLIEHAPPHRYMPAVR